MSPRDTPVCSPLIGQVILAVAGTLVFGFIALLVFWTAGTWPARLPGLFAYRAATFGDALLLPALAGLLVLGFHTMRSEPRPARWGVVAAVVGGGLAGAGLQALWLADNSPDRNWTLPRAHHFDSAGWYHAGFLVVACAAFAGALVALALKVRNAHADSDCSVRVLDSWQAAFGWACLFGFAGFLAIDNRNPDGTLASASTVAVLVIASAILVLLAGFALRWRGPRRIAASVALGATIGVALTVAVAEVPRARFDLCLAAVVCSAGLAIALGEPVRTQIDRRLRARWSSQSH
jgi:FtsH-binding integral membrane protein